ncbi:similar to An12g08700 [Aspergillus luchuensis IFO 4308]|nr:similar to An12g08700 [Aspergillus luchuensis IFO 4308]
MMLGTGVGDILACARLAYKLYQELSETNGFFREYRTISSRLLTVHKALLQVEQLRAANQLTQSTLNAIRFLASKMSEAINGFVNRLEGLRASQAGWSGLALKDIFSPAQKLSSILHSNLLSLSSLLRMACYSDSDDDDAWKSASVTPRWIDERSEFPHVRLSAMITGRDTCCARPKFEKVPKPIDFFRPGRVFTVAMRGISTATGDEDIECTPPPKKWTPLDSIPDPCEREKERLTRQKKNYEDIIKLPLKAMFRYGEIQEDGQIQYEMSTDRPVLSASEVEEMTDNEYNLPTWNMDPWVGVITIRRFVVVQQGTKSCLCLGIHTYSGRGCSDQSDQVLYAILHLSKYIPDPLPEEARMTSQPIRLKLEQPSTVLPSSARIYFGRVYEIKHDVELNNVGLVLGSSMNILSSQFESHRPIDTPNCLASSPDKDQAGTFAGDTVTQTDVKIEK